MPDSIKDALLIYNPTSGRRRHRRFAEIEQAVRLLKDAGIATELAPTKGPLSAKGIARAAVVQRRGMVIACGGDGTINEIVNGLAGSQIPMALLPAGTANILAKELRIPWDIPHASRLIPDGVVRRIALGIAIPTSDNHSTEMPREGRYFLSVAGAGPDGAIVNAVSHGLKKTAGVLAYWAEGARQIVRYNFPEMRVRSGGAERLRHNHCRGTHGELRWPIQNHHASKSVRGFLRISHEFIAQPFSLPRLLAAAVAWQAARRRRNRDVESHRSDLRTRGRPTGLCSSRWRTHRPAAVANFESCRMRFRWWSRQD